MVPGRNPRIPAVSTVFPRRRRDPGPPFYGGLPRAARFGFLNRDLRMRSSRTPRIRQARGAPRRNPPVVSH